MFRILKKEQLAENIWLMDVEAPRIAKHALPGQFLIVRLDAEGERIPLTVCDYDPESGVVQIVFQVVGGETYRMAALEEGDSFHDIVGPLGRPSDLTELSIDELKKTFTPEFVNRVDDIIFFRMLGKDSLVKIVDILMKQVGKRIRDLGMEIELTESAKELLAKKGYDPQYGSRPLRRVITSMVEDRFSEAMLDGIVKPGHLAIIDAVETSDPDALLAQGSAAEDGKVIVIKDGGALEISSNSVIQESASTT